MRDRPQAKIPDNHSYQRQLGDKLCSGLLAFERAANQLVDEFRLERGRSGGEVGVRLFEVSKDPELLHVFLDLRIGLILSERLGGNIVNKHWSGHGKIYSKSNLFEIS